MCAQFVHESRSAVDSITLLITLSPVVANARRYSHDDRHRVSSLISGDWAAAT